MSDNFQAKDASGASVTFISKDTGGGVQLSAHYLADATTPTRQAAVTAGSALKVDGSAVTQPVSASALPLPTGAATAVKQPALGTAGTASTDVITVQGIASGTPQPISGSVGVIPATSGGLTPFKLISAATTNATSVKGSAGQLYSVQVFNATATIGYLKLYNKATAPTVGTDVPVKVILIPASASGTAVTMNFTDHGAAFSLGIALALTTGIADTDTGSVALNAHIVNLDYK